jgi:hypothetical protein
MIPRLLACTRRPAGVGRGVDPESNVVDVYVRHLRRKLGDGVIAAVRAWATGSSGAALVLHLDGGSVRTRTCCSLSGQPWAGSCGAGRAP